ncbi:hypothetical protein Syun_018242 [Stephania yunnanensis]|uniref:Protein transport protein sec16 n=1 Tax=Stephania yunnanensis TaxID=152371 RepID=A0AAP0NWU9_9MAGN
MASPPFTVEDQTDEDFFDKLVDDEFVVPESGPSVVADSADFDEVKALSNLRIGEISSVSEDSGGENGFAVEGEDHTDHSQGVTVPAPSPNVAEKENVALEENVSVVASDSFDSFAPAHAVQSSNDAANADVSTELTESKDSGSRNSGVKEVLWSSFYADSTQNGGFGSSMDSDFFTGFGDSSVDPFASLGDGLKVDSEQTSISGGAQNVVGNSNETFGSIQYNNGQMVSASQAQTSEQELLSSQYWEDSYPGWRYDPNTGQWYAVEGAEVAENLGQTTGGKSQTVDNNVVSNQTSEVSYLQQTVQSVGNAAQDFSTASVSTWNQTSQDNNGYPEHMVFDPQYPGWYYDTIALEWRSLESYTSANQSTNTGYVQQTKSENDSSSSFYSAKEHTLYNDGQIGSYGSHSIYGDGQGANWAYSSSTQFQQNNSIWQPDAVAKSEAMTHFTDNNRQSENIYSSRVFDNAMPKEQMGFKPIDNASSHEPISHGYGINNSVPSLQSFVPVNNYSQQLNQPRLEQSQHVQFSRDFYGNQQSVSHSLASFHSGTQLPYSSNEGRSSAGRPSHALVSFGFGGKLIVMKDSNSFTNSMYGNQDGGRPSVSVLDLMDIVVGKNGENIVADANDYFSTLCRQSFPGPLGGSAGSKEVNKWIDERIGSCESPNIDYKKGQLLKLLLSLLKISCQHYGKLRSPFGSDPSLKESERPESALANLFASGKSSAAQFSGYDTISQCLHNLPSEGQMQAAAAEVEKLLVSGRTKEALYYAQQGQLWGLALVLAAKLGDQYYVDTVKQMALHQFKRGSPLRTLCLLIAGQQAEVFSSDNTIGGGLPGTGSMSNQHGQLGANGVLDNWEENLAIITSNRTEKDELVIMHLGDCIWKESGEIYAAHACYLVAEANFESFSDGSRLCLIGADHWNFPRTYASPDAIQRTELYEYSKVLGNSQSVLLPFQPYKLIYAHMLAEVGKLSDSLKYCQAISKSLKTGRIPEVEAWKQSLSLLEERIKTHQQGGFSANLAAGKLVGKIIPFLDRSIHRMIGPPPPPAPSAQGIEQDSPPMGVRENSQSAMQSQFLMPSSASMEPISEWKIVSNKATLPNRSISEPDFGRSPIQGQVSPSSEGASSDSQSKPMVTAGASRFGRLGSNLLQKTMGWVSRSRNDRQAKLGEKNKFYYDEKLKRWVEEGVDPPAEETALPPPPTATSFQNGHMEDSSKSSGLPSNGWPEVKTPIPPEHNSGGMPPIPPSSNQFSARGRMGVRSRYVDTFNKGGGAATNLFHSPPLPAAKPNVGAAAKFFVPAPVTFSEETPDATGERVQEAAVTDEVPSTSMQTDSSFSSPLQSQPPPTSLSLAPPPSSMSSMQRFPSMGNIPSSSSNGMNGSFSRRTASWSGASIGSSSPLNPNEGKSLGEALGMPPSSFMPNHNHTMPSPLSNGGSFGDLHEVEL